MAKNHFEQFAFSCVEILQVDHYCLQKPACEECTWSIVKVAIESHPNSSIQKDNINTESTRQLPNRMYRHPTKYSCLAILIVTFHCKHNVEYVCALGLCNNGETLKKKTCNFSLTYTSISSKHHGLKFVNLKMNDSNTNPIL